MDISKTREEEIVISAIRLCIGVRFRDATDINAMSFDYVIYLEWVYLITVSYLM